MRSNFVSPAHIEAIVYRTLPSRVLAADMPVVTVFGELDIKLDATKGRHDPIYFKARVQVSEDKSLTVLSFLPLFGSIGGAASTFLSIWQEVFEDAIRRSNILGVR